MTEKMKNMHPGFILRLPQAHYDKLEIIKQRDGIAISQQIKIAVARYLQKGII